MEVSIIVESLLFAENLEFINEAYKSQGLFQTKEINDLLKIIHKNKRINKEKLSYYFKNYDLYNNPTDIPEHCIMDFDYSGKDFDEFIEGLCNKDKKDILKEIIFSVTLAKLRSVEKASAYVDSLEYIDEKIVMENINEIKGFYEYKWKLAELISNGEAIYKEFAGFLMECREILKSPMEKLIKMGEKWADYLEGELEANGIEFITNTIIKISYDKSTNMVVYPKVIACYNCILYPSKDSSKLELELGYRVFDMVKSFKGKDEEEWIFNVLKSLSDGSRYEILRLLSQKKMYGGELAGVMKLSVGTISYHTSNLLLTGLIKEKRVNSRIYYESDKEKLLKWSKIFEKTFKS